MTSLSHLLSRLLLPVIGSLPPQAKQRLRNSPVQTLYRQFFGHLGKEMDDGLLRIHGGPLKGMWIDIDPARRGYLVGHYEPEVTVVIEQLCEKGMTMADIGAHYGYFTLLMATCVGEEGQVISFEAMSANFQRIAHSLQANKLDNVLLEHAAIGLTDGEGLFGTHYKDDLMGRLADHIGVQSEAFPSHESVPVRSLDSYVAEHQMDRLDLIKIDVEGAELEVLTGAWETLVTLRPTVLVEVHDFLPANELAQPVVKHLVEAEYEVIDLITELPVCVQEFQGGRILASPLT